MTTTTTSAPSAGGSAADPADVGIPVLELVAPLAGFPEHRRFALARLDETGLVCELRSLDDPELRFVVVPPAPFFPDYAPELDDAVADQLGLEGEDDLLALLVVTLGATVDAATANLLAPILVNHHTRRAGQFLLSDADLPTRALLAPTG